VFHFSTQPISNKAIAGLGSMPFAFPASGLLLRSCFDTPTRSFARNLAKRNRHPEKHSMWKKTLAASFAAAALAVAAPAEAGPLTRSSIGPRQFSTASVFSRFNIAALNPQPLPPRWSPLNSFNTKALNPQPLPPRWSPFSSLNTKALNPQPLPPLQVFGVGSSNLTPRRPPISQPSKFPPALPKITTIQ